jgi:hypothetical protein
VNVDTGIVSVVAGVVVEITTPGYSILQATEVPVVMKGTSVSEFGKHTSSNSSCSAVLYLSTYE